MLHWNSLWAPTQPDGKTELETAPVWKEPWPAEQMMAWQTLGWEQWLNAGHAWWSLWTAMLSMPVLAAQGLGGDGLPKAANDATMAVLPDALPPQRTSAKRSSRNAAR